MTDPLLEIAEQLEARAKELREIAARRAAIDSVAVPLRGGTPFVGKGVRIAGSEVVTLARMTEENCDPGYDRWEAETKDGTIINVKVRADVDEDPGVKP